ATADAASSRQLLQEAEDAASAERAAAHSAIADATRQLAEAAAVARDAGERHAKETGALREEARRLGAELESFAVSKDVGNKEAVAALAEKARELSETMEGMKKLEACVHAGNAKISALESQVAEGKEQLQCLTEELDAQRKEAVDVAQAGEQE
ncbi:unnamed protein product, partial [Sphacelaria rigidula]